LSRPSTVITRVTTDMNIYYDEVHLLNRINQSDINNRAEIDVYCTVY